MGGEYTMAGEVGTGTGFGRAVIIVAGVCALVASLLTVITTFFQVKNYRKPLLQRHVIRIFMMVPIFSAASWASLTSIRVAYWIDPFRDVYEAFTLYTFFQLLVNFLGGERSLIIMMHGRAPVEHLWPLNHVLPKVDISDPHTFLSIKRGILQYAYIKPVLAVATIAMKATGTFKEGIISVDSGYFWTSVIYNVSISWSLYDLALFWICMSEDLQPFRPMPKFLCIKGIIFASWWQGFFLSILVWLKAIPSTGGGYTADNLAAAIQDALICFEMPFFAITHWFAFSWKDYADRTISDARMPIRFAIRDAFGPRDLIEDAKETISGKKYDYRYFDAHDNVIGHEESASRIARMREGMRYERGGRGKYWIPNPGDKDAKQPLLNRFADDRARNLSPARGSGDRDFSKGYGTHNELEEPELDAEEETLYGNARALEFGDWNYPVINTHYASRKDRLVEDPNIVTASTNRSILQPTTANQERRKSRIKKIQKDLKDSHRGSSSSGASGRALSSSSKDKGKGKARASSSDSNNSHRSQLLDLVVEDHHAAEVERVRARKEGGPGWNAVGKQKHFVKVHQSNRESNGESAVVEEVRQGFNPDKPEATITDESHTLDGPFSVGDDDGEDVPVQDKQGKDETGANQPWDKRVYPDGAPFEEERNVWGS
ncbi:transmembrane protein [Acrodontium crateriforme]|uniref:Transmembrane protein n=1 Tax=Acrodontium crateriforme TaxID=150365 RepID=A0AAQ3LX24_9PEZI|nr:transmembrane protein [Acrodontium crateriforme]